MNIIKVTGVDRALAAGEWCNEEFGTDGWDINLNHLMTGIPEYQFMFAESKNATMFALKWA